MRLGLVAVVALAGTPLAVADDLVLPLGYQNLAGGGSFLGPLSTAQRTYQLLIHADQLQAVAGMNLTGIAWRSLPSSTTPWPSADVMIANYDIYLGRSVPPADRSLTFASNVAGPQTQVRAGVLTIATNSYGFGGTPTPFGPTIEFDQPWVYTEGHLLIEVRHGGFSGTSRSVDAVTATNTTAGYGAQFSGVWVGNYTPPATGMGANFAAIRLTAAAGGGCYANCDGSTVEPILNVADFSCFLWKFAAGCR